MLPRKGITLVFWTLVVTVPMGCASGAGGDPADTSIPDAPTGSSFTAGGQRYAVADAPAGGNAVIWRLDAGGSRVDPLDVGPVSGPIVDVEAAWGWLWVVDGNTLYRAKLDSRAGAWWLARRVWSTVDTVTIQSIDVAGTQLAIHTSSGTEFFIEADLAFRDCDGDAPAGFDYETGQTYTHGGLIDFTPGTLPVFLSVPHNGTVVPADWLIDPEMASRDGGSLAFALLLAEELDRLTGRRPGLIVNNVQRNILNLNIAWTATANPMEPNYGNPDAEAAWNAYHDFVDAQKAWVAGVCGSGLYIDVHTSGLEHQKSMLGFQLTTGQINLLDAELDLLVERSNLRGLLDSDSGFLLSKAVRGPLSLGALLNLGQYPFLPNDVEPIPPSVVGGGTQYFRGGYNADRHGSRHDGGPVDGLHLENDWRYINNGLPGIETAAVRRAYAEHVAATLIDYLERWYGFVLVR